MGSIESICCRDHTNIAHISAGIFLWTYVDWDLFAHLSEYYTPLKSVNIFHNMYMENNKGCFNHWAAVRLNTKRKNTCLNRPVTYPHGAEPFLIS
jgi:hypothetical protein